MAIPVLICDDSGLARKQMFRSLPAEWEVDVSYATNGLEGINAIQKGLGEVTFLDLNMPEMDGYQVLEQIRKMDLPAMVIVVSGDIQPEVYARVTKMGAMDFIKKPISSEKLTEVLVKFGIIEETQLGLDAGLVSMSTAEPRVLACYNNAVSLPEVNFIDCYREIANIAMGQAADLLARLLGAFVKMPIPNISFFGMNDFLTAIQAVKKDKEVSAVSQGFIGAGISGEAMVLFEDASFDDMAQLMKFQGEIGSAEELELLLDTANVLIGATLRGIGEQMGLAFSQSHPVILGRNCKVESLIKHNTGKWKRVFAIEINYKIENYNINCDLLLLFSEEDMPKINQRLAYLQ